MRLQVVNTTRDKILADRVVKATTFFARFIGLMGRRELPMGEGLLLDPCNGVHTFFMRIPIDAVFLDGQGRIVRLFPALPPWRMTPVSFDTRQVLELPAGTCAASETVEGDTLRFTPLNGFDPPGHGRVTS